MLKSLTSRRGLATLALVLVFAYACFLLGRWQWSRYEDKDVRAQAVAANYHAAPTSLGAVLPTTATVPREDQVWTRVTVTGTYAADRQLLVRGRTLDSTPGMEVLVPLQVDSGRLLLVNRGWVANADDAATLPRVDPAPSGPVRVTGWLKPSEDSRGRELPPGQLASVNTDDAAAQLGERVGDGVYAAYLVMGEETTAGGESPARPRPLEEPTGSLGPHQAYAVQWWLTALLGIGFVTYLARDAAQRRAAAQSRVGTDAAPGTPSPTPASPATPVTSGGTSLGLGGQPGVTPRASKPAKPKKQRIWDEEDG